MIDTDKRKAEGKYLSLTELSPCDTFWSECFGNVMFFFPHFSYPHDTGEKIEAQRNYPVREKCSYQKGTDIF